MASRGSSSWRTTHWGKPCAVKLTTVELNGATVKVDTRARVAFEALAMVLRKHRYAVHPHYPDGDTGSYNCRKIGGTSTFSSHSWGVAVDVNWNSNPYRRDKLVTDMPRAMIEEVEGLRTTNGAPVLRWGGDWDGRPETPHSNYDAMHFEVVATPAELATGVVGFGEGSRPTPVTSSEEENMLQRGDQGNAVAKFQKALLAFNPKCLPKFGADADFGGETEEAVKAYQRAADLDVTGRIDGVTSALLMAKLAGGSTTTAAHTHAPQPHTHPVSGAVRVAGTDALGTELAKHLKVTGRLSTGNPG